MATLYKTLVRPHLDYANLSWKPILNEEKVAIEIVLPRATRLIPSLCK